VPHSTNHSVAEEFHHSGFVVVRNVLKDDDLMAMNTLLVKLMATLSPERHANQMYRESDGKGVRSVIGIDEIVPEFRKFDSHPKISALISCIYPNVSIRTGPVFFFNKPAGGTSAVLPHQDNAFFAWDPPDAFTLTLALDESDWEHGALHFHPKSHLLGTLPHKSTQDHAFPYELQGRLSESDYPPSMVCLKPGDIVLHHVNTVHWSSQNSTRDSRRHIALGCYSSESKPLAFTDSVLQ
jgi:phytanoyl-CoA hydroxylase